MQIRDHAFLITGGSSGLGAATARRIIELGGNALLVDLAEAEGRRMADELGSAARFVRADVTSEAEMQNAVDEARREWGELRGVVHCAGVIGGARVVGKQGPHQLALFERIVRVNLVGTFNVARLAAAAMTANLPEADGERGVLVLTSSVAAFDGQIGQAAYASSKGGVASLALPMARELARFGIRVVAIAPGVFETPMVLGLDAAVQQSLAAQAPFPARLGRPEEFALLAQQIIENRMLNGAVIRLDAAIRMAGK
jgi:NAD(P)-dependent dehydrogenase (short-subunit alcohol dehydrogenase family)